MTDIDKDNTEEERIQRLLEGAGRRPAMPDDVRARLEQSFRSELSSTQEKHRIRQLGKVTGIAASLFIATVLMFTLTGNEPRDQVAQVTRDKGETNWSYKDESGPLRSGNTIQQGDRISTSTGTVSMTPTGSSIDIRIAAMSELTFVDSNTIQLKRGSIYIDSDPENPHYPLSIEANGLSVTHIGTQYLVSRLDDVIEVAVREGKVKIDHGSDAIQSHGEQGLGELTLFEGGALVEQSSITAHDPRWSWAAQLSPSINTDGLLVAEFVEWVSRQTGYAIVYDNVALAPSDRLRGLIDTTDALDALDEGMSVTPFLATIDSDQGRIVISPR